MRRLLRRHVQAPTSPAGRRVIHHLLTQRPSPVTARRVAGATGVSFQTASGVLRFLEFHGAVSPGRPAERLHWRRLADIASALRLPFIDPKRALEGDNDARTLAKGLQARDVPFAFGFTTAANLWAFFEPDPATHIIVARPALKDAVAALKTAHGASSTKRAPGPIVLFADDLELLDLDQLRGLPVTSLLQTWLDLRQFPHAGAHAAFFQEVLAERFPEVRSA